MTKAQKEKRAALNGTIFIIVLAMVIALAIVGKLSPEKSTTIVVTEQTVPYARDFPPMVQYFKHYQVRYQMLGTQWVIDSIGIDDTYEQNMSIGCDGSENNDEAQNCILIGADSIKDFFEQLEEMNNSNI